MTRREKTQVFSDVLFNPLSLETLSESIADLAPRREAGTFNLGSHEGMSKADFAFRLAETLGLPSEVLVRGVSTDLSLAARRPLDMRMDCSLFERTFGRKLPTLDSEIKSMRTQYGIRS